jgi:hypothetical protein
MPDVVSVVAQASTSSNWVDAPVSSTVSDSDAARFADLMSTQATQAQAPSQVQGPSVVPPTGVAETSAAHRPGRSMGDAILSNLDSLGRHYTEQNSEINSFLSADGAELSPGRLLRLQIQMLDQSVVVDVASRVISKGVQELDQLTKLQ